MARDRRKEMLRIGVLLDECQICPKQQAVSQQTEAVCGGCSVFAELRQLGAGLQKPSVNRFQHILEKGEDMTRSEIAFLLENEVQKKEIQKALNMGTLAFNEMMVNYGFSKKKKK